MIKWLTTALKFIARNPWVWALGSQVNKYIIKPIINKIKKKKNGKENGNT